MGRNRSMLHLFFNFDFYNDSTSLHIHIFYRVFNGKKCREFPNFYNKSSDGQKDRKLKTEGSNIRTSDINSVQVVIQ